MTEPTPSEQYHVSPEESQEAIDMPGKGYRKKFPSYFDGRTVAKLIAFKIINARQVDVDALIDAIIDAAKDEIKAGL